MSWRTMFLRPALRTSVLRTLLVVTLANLGLVLSYGEVVFYAPDGEGVIALVLNVFVLVHHIVSLFRLRWFNATLDLVLLLTELGLSLYKGSHSWMALHEELRFSNYDFDPFTVAFGCLYTIQALCLIWMTGVRISLISQNGKSSLREPFVYTKDYPNEAQIKPFSFLFLQQLWDNNARSMRGESVWITASRLVLAVLVAASVVTFAVYVLIVQPVVTSGTDISTKSYYDVDTIRQQIDLSVILSAISDSDYSTVNVTGIIDQGHGSLDVSAFTNHTPIASGLEGIRVDCNSPVYTNAGAELLITVNVTQTYQATGFSSIPGMNKVDICVGDNASTNDEIRHYGTHIFLEEGMHVQATLLTHYRETISEKSALSAFGLGPTKRFLVVDFSAVLPETRPERFQQGPGLATLRIKNGRSTQYEEIIQDYNEHSVFSALSSLGGYWAFANGLFAVVFGAGLLFFILGIRPMSIFGLVHLAFNKGIRSEIRRDYPRMFSEGGRRGDPEAGAVAFIRDHLVNFGDEPKNDDNGKDQLRPYSLTRMASLSFEPVAHPDPAAFPDAPKYSSISRA